MNQTLALFIDAYRELNAKKLFWITLLLSLVFAGAIAALGINENGITILWFELDFPFNTTVMTEETYYKLIFINFGLGLWLAWIAAILALVSTAQIFPDFISGGSIELTLSKPIGRTRLFFTKYLTGLFFVGLQVTAFSLACFLVIGLRGNTWEPGLFLAVPLVVLFFSYLFSVCALLGLITKSTIAALLLTLLFWFVIFLANSADALTLGVLTTNEVRAESLAAQIERVEDQLDQRRQQLEAVRAEIDTAEEPRPSSIEEAETLEGRIAAGERFLDSLALQLNDAESDADNWRPWHQGVFAVKTILPKTGETIALLERWLIDLADLDPQNFNPSQPNSTNDDAALLFGEGNVPNDTDPNLSNSTNERVNQKIRERSVFWVIGTSLIFELIVLAIAAVYFKRKDF